MGSPPADRNDQNHFGMDGFVTRGRYDHRFNEKCTCKPALPQSQQQPAIAQQSYHCRVVVVCHPSFGHSHGHGVCLVLLNTCGVFLVLLNVYGDPCVKEINENSIQCTIIGTCCEIHSYLVFCVASTLAPCGDFCRRNRCKPRFTMQQITPLSITRILSLALDPHGLCGCGFGHMMAVQ